MSRPVSATSTSTEGTDTARAATAAAPVASIVLCTRNRAESLLRALRSLEDERSRTSAELIVVDNGSSDGTSEVVNTWARQAPFPVKLVREPAIGLAHARNAGVRAAEGEYILFLDDDVIVHRHWVDETVAAFEPGVAMVAGRVMPQYTFRAPSWLAGGGATGISLFDYGETPFDMNHENMPLGANMAILSAELRALDPPFHPQLGHTGTVRTGHEEFFVAERVTGRIRYAPCAVVHHVVDPRRADLRFARRAYFQLGFGRARYDRLRGIDDPRLSRRVARALWMLLKTLGLRLWSRRHESLTAAEVRRQLAAYYHLGHSIDQLLRVHRSAADWCARALP